MTTRQSSAVATTLPRLQSGIQAAATATNIQSTLLNDLRVVPSVQSSHEQGHYGMPNLMYTASNPRMSFTAQPEEQVTNASTTLSGALFTSRPVRSARAVNTGTFTVTATPWGPDQSNVAVVRHP